MGPEVTPTLQKLVKCVYVELPVTDYREAWQLQQTILQHKIEDRSASDIVLALEHPPVFTLGRRGGIENLCVEESVLKKESIDVVRVERGGRFV